MAINLVTIHQFAPKCEAGYPCDMLRCLDSGTCDMNFIRQEHIQVKVRLMNKRLPTNWDGWNIWSKNMGSFHKQNCHVEGPAPTFRKGQESFTPSKSSWWPQVVKGNFMINPDDWLIETISEHWSICCFWKNCWFPQTFMDSTQMIVVFQCSTTLE